MRLITKLFKDHGYKDILGSLDDDIEYLNEIKNNRSSASKTGIYTADTILIPLEDGDRAEILKKSGKNIITIDLNPLSRTSKMSDVSIMDNIVRAIPFMTKIAEDLKAQDKKFLMDIVNEFDNEENLIRGAQWIASIMRSILSTVHLNYYSDKIKEELDKKTESQLIKDFILLYGDEKDDAYETCYAIWNNIYEILNKEIAIRNEDQ